MRVTSLDDDFAVIRLSRSELTFLNNAVNEVCNGVHDLAHDGEFATRLGWSRQEARQLLAQLHDVLG